VTRSLDPRAVALVRQLGLQPHPEGGFYREIFRSPRTVTASDRPDPRAALTSIYYLLPRGARSRWHRVASDEAWMYHEGDPLELLTLDAGGRLTRHHLGPLADGTVPQVVVPAGTWQAARALGAYTLAGCAVGPGFAFDDFTLLADAPAERARLEALGADLAELL
jgi:hypothetical protein